MAILVTLQSRFSFEHVMDPEIQQHHLLVRYV